MDQNRIKRNQMLGAKIVKELTAATWKLIIQTPRRGSEESIGINPGRKQHLLGRFHVCQ